MTHVQFGERASEKYCRYEAATRRCPTLHHVRFGGRERRVLTEARPSRPNAELGAAFTCAELGIEPTLRHADYLASWLD